MHFYQFLPCVNRYVVSACTLRIVSFWRTDPFITMYVMPFFIPDDFPYLEVSLSEVNVATTPAFFQLGLAWHFFPKH